MLSMNSATPPAWKSPPPDWRLNDENGTQLHGRWRGKYARCSAQGTNLMRRELRKARRAEGNKKSIPLATVKRELGLP